MTPLRRKRPKSPRFLGLLSCDGKLCLIKVQQDLEVKDSKEKFISQLDDVEAQLKSDTIGLVHLDDFEKRRKELEQNANKVAEAAAKKKRKKETKKSSHELSFAFDEDDAPLEKEL